MINEKPLLITGGAGFLGSHMVAFCLENNIKVVVLDNLVNSNLNNLKKLEAHFKKRIPFFKIDLKHYDDVINFFNKKEFDGVIHFAGLKSVSESVKDPLKYYENNVIGSKNLIEAIKINNIKKIIFSSSATVYGNPIYLPIDENHPISPINPYGQNKADVENLFIEDKYFESANVKLLRYFNPIGSYKGIICEEPNGVPNNLMPYILGVANGKFKYLNIFGDDYDTSDGTGVRDYIHVMDLVGAHWYALKDHDIGCKIFNVGCGMGYSVKHIVESFQDVNKVQIPYIIQPRRDGDIAASYASVKKINNELDWFAKKGIQEMCEDAWRAVC